MCAAHAAPKTRQNQMNNCIASFVKWKNILSQEGVIGLTAFLDECTNYRSEAVAIRQEQNQLHQ